MGGAGNAPFGCPPGSALPTGTAFLASPHLGADHIARRDAGASCRRAAVLTIGAPGSRPVGRSRKAEIGLLQAADLVAQSGGLFKFEIRSGVAHALFQISDDRLQIGALIMRSFALRQSVRDVISLVNALQDVRDASANALRGDAMRGVVSLLLFAPAIGLVDRGFETVGHPVGVQDRTAVDVAGGPSDSLD